MTDSRTVPEALPREAIKAIWSEVLPDYDPKVFAAICEGDVLPGRDALTAFVEIAVAKPHYASTRDIAKATGVDPQSISWILRNIRTQSREARQWA